MVRAARSAVVLVLGLLLVGCESISTEQRVSTKSCISLQQCLELLETIEVGKYGIGENEQAFAKSFTRFGEAALDELLQRLDIGGNRGKIVGYAIASFNPIDEKYLPQIVEGVKKDVSWLAGALGNIPTEKGAEAAVDAYLVSDSAPHNQEAHAVIKQGERAVPFIIQRMQCGERCSDIRPSLLVYIVEEMDDAAKVFVAKSIVERLNEPDISRANQANLIALFFKMGPQGLVVEKDLEDLAQISPKLSPLIDQAFVGIHSVHSGRVLAEWIKQNPYSSEILYEAVKLGSAAKDAGPAIMELLVSESLEIKVNAVRALGFIEYEPAEQVLIPLMEDEKNIQLSWVAVSALSRLGNTASIPALHKVAEEYWHPAVRKEAKLAIEAIQQRQLETTKEKKVGGAGAYPFSRFDVQSCEKVALKALPIDKSQKLYGFDNPALEALKYPSYVIGYKAGDEEEQKASEPDGVIEINRHNIVEVRTEVSRTPHVAVRAENGWLTGYYGGEWGGELTFVPDSGEPQKLQDGNVRDIFKFDGFFVAISGVAHLRINRGVVYRIQKDADDWKVDHWIALPGAPEDTWLAETGEVVIDTYSGGTIMLSEDGNLRMSPCDGYEEH